MTSSELDGEIRNGRHYMQIRVYYEDTDFSGIVYHANYLRFMERGRTNHLRLMGAEQHALFEQAKAETPGFAFVVRSMDIDFLRPARMDDVLEVVTWPVAVKLRQRHRRPAAAASASRAARRARRPAARARSPIPRLPPAPARRQQPHPHPVDPAGVGVHHLELGALGMQHHLAPRRHPAGEADDEAAEGVDLLGRARGRQPHAGRRLEVVEVHARLREVDARRLLAPERLSASSCSSAMSPTICSSTFSMVTRPSTPPYSSITSAMWMRAACIFCSSTQIGIDGGA